MLNLNQVGNASNGDTARTRTFNYDSLSRLHCASNPENSTASCPTSSRGAYVSGTTGYTYDANGNVVSKVDARGITASYSYDSLNRLVSKSYSDGATPYACYQYDGSAGSSSIGRLVAEWTVAGSQSGGCAAAAPSSGFITMKRVLSYDPMGRPLSEQQCTPNTSGPGNCATSLPSPFSLSYFYDLAGNLTAYANGVNSVPDVGTIGFGIQYNGAGQLQNVTGSWNPSTGANSLSLFTADTNGYTAAGAIQSILLGNDVSVTKTYDSRLRVTGETAMHP
jgi:YD repeat-containing protein